MTDYPSIDEFACPDYRCKDCRYFKFSSNGGCGHRFDHSKMNYARAYFLCTPEELGFPCADFQPSKVHKSALPFWHGYKHWREWMDRQNEEEYAEVHQKYKRKDDNDVLIGFRLKKFPHEFYYVRLKDYINGTMFDNGKLKAIKRKYYKQVKELPRYEIISEDIDGVEI